MSELHMDYTGGINPSTGRPHLVLYHGQCRDGFCAAWAAYQRFPKAEFRPVMYGTPPPTHEEVAGRRLLLVDFCYPRGAMMSLASSTMVTVLDHHKTAQAALDGIQDELARTYGLSIDVVFDMDRSGAGIAWNVLIRDFEPRWCGDCGAASGHQPGCERNRPWLVNYVEDRDLWRWALPDSREVNAYISTFKYGHPENFKDWDTIAEKIKLQTAQIHGTTALSAVRRYAEAACENAILRDIGMFKGVPSVNCPQHDISEVLEHLMDLNPWAPFVHGWWQRSDGLFAQSFRSRGDFDVSTIAKSFGGGGHKNAAGAQTQNIL